MCSVEPGILYCLQQEHLTNNYTNYILFVTKVIRCAAIRQGKYMVSILDPRDSKCSIGHITIICSQHKTISVVNNLCPYQKTFTRKT